MSGLKQIQDNTCVFKVKKTELLLVYITHFLICFVFRVNPYAFTTKINISIQTKFKITLKYLLVFLYYLTHFFT